MNYFITDKEKAEMDIGAVRDQIDGYTIKDVASPNWVVSSVPNGAEITHNAGYSMAYDPENKERYFVGYAIGPKADSELINRKQFLNSQGEEPFRHRDPKNPKHNFEALENTGQHNGHMAGQRAVQTTAGAEGALASYEDTNIEAMRGSFNTGIWKNMEMDYIKKAQESGDTYYMLMGSLPTDEVVGRPAVGFTKNPDKFWFIIYKVDKDTGEFEPDAFLIDEDTPFRDYYEQFRTTTERISELRGMDFSQIIDLKEAGE